jgi:Calcineurin-like phosphoesterase
MSATLISENDFVALFRELGPTGLGRHMGMNVRSIYGRRRDIESRLGITIEAPTRPKGNAPEGVATFLDLDIETGIAVVFSDAHYWPGYVSTAHRALVKFCKEFRPKVVIANGDMVDGATISRHPPINWEQQPSLIQEIETVQDRLGEVTLAAEGARRVWDLGNHDARFESRLANVAPEYAKVHGLHLKDHFSDWEPTWATCVNDEVVVKHRFKGGIHASHNNTLWAGKTIVTGHLHSLKVTPFSDYNGTRWGVDTGTLADPYGPQFEYQEMNPRNHRSGFAVLTFYRGRLLWPELVHVIGQGEVEFRGKVWTV